MEVVENCPANSIKGLPLAHTLKTTTLSHYMPAPLLPQLLVCLEVADSAATYHSRQTLQLPRR